MADNLSRFHESDKERIFLVEFTWNDGGSSARYTDWSSAFGDFAATPTMDIVFPEFTGMLDERPTKITLDVDDFTGALAGGSPHAPVAVTVKEMYRRAGTGAGALTLVTLVGEVSKTVKNPKGKRDRVLIEVLGVKEYLKNACGFPATHQCDWYFGDPHTCQVDAVAVEEQGTITLGDKNTCTITGLADHSADPTYWYRGFVKFEGLTIPIRSMTGTDTFELARRPASSWNGNQVTVRPGCDKSQEVCDSRWNNHERFGGVGYAIPAYQPLYETE